MRILKWILPLLLVVMICGVPTGCGETRSNGDTPWLKDHPYRQEFTINDSLKIDSNLAGTIVVHYAEGLQGWEPNGILHLYVDKVVTVTAFTKADGKTTLDWTSRDLTDTSITCQVRFIPLPVPGENLTFYIYYK